MWRPETVARVEVRIASAGPVLAPVGMPTPFALPARFACSAPFKMVTEASTRQNFAVAEGPVTFSYRFAHGGTDYPERMFQHRASRFTTASEALKARAEALAPTPNAAGLVAIVDHVRESFQYAHPEARFNDGAKAVPEICSLTAGSCVDINTYLVAALRAAGYETGYVTGIFFPEDKAGRANDSHCWVVTRCEGAIQEWDIAHHLKMGKTTVAPGLNPKPGLRVPMAHSMGLHLPSLGLSGIKAILQPMRIAGTGLAPVAAEIRMTNWFEVFTDTLSAGPVPA